MHQHDQSPSPDVVDQPGETNESNGGYVVNYLLFEILCRKTRDKKKDSIKTESNIVWSLIDQAVKTGHSSTVCVRLNLVLQMINSRHIAHYTALPL